MLRQDDLDLAVERGLISAEQARGLTEIAAERHKARRFALGREERFRLLGGFNDFFVALGVLLLGFGLSYAPMAIMMATAPTRVPVAVKPDAQLMLALATFSALVYWGLAEWLTARLRLTAPSIVVTVFWVLAAAGAASAWAIWLGGRGSGKTELLVMSGGALTAAALHYARFRLPFTLLPLAVSAFVLVVAAYAAAAGPSAATRPDDIAHVLRWVSLGVGLSVFLVAMRFDLSDPERLTRAADCAFWLHLAAAPMIVHPLASTLIDHPFFGTAARGAQAAPVTATTLVSVVALTLALAAVALVIDRRALLVAGLGYLGAAVTYAISKAGAAPGVSTMATLLFLGITIIILGTGWRGLRSAIMSALPSFPLKSRLPPYIGAS